LQLIAAQKNKINEEDVKLWSREREEKIFTLLKLIFKSYDIKSAMESFDNLNEDLDMLLLWLDQNIPAEYKKAIERCTAYKSLSDADIFLSRIMRWQHWRFLVYAQALAIAGVQQAKKSTNPNFVTHQRPELLLSLYIRAAKRKKIKGLGAQVANILHASSTRLAKSFWPYFVYIQEHNEKQAAELSEYLGL
jgi:replication factor C large subunit